MRYTQLKKVLLVAVFSVLAVLVVLPVRDAYAEETTTPSKMVCAQNWTLEGDNNNGYKCTNKGAGAVGPNPFECPAGWQKANGEDISAHGVLFAQKCVKAAPNPAAGKPKVKITTVEPTGKDCSRTGPDGEPRGDKDGGYWCYDELTLFHYEIKLTCPAGSEVQDGKKTEYAVGSNPTKKKCVSKSTSSTLTPEQRQKVKEAEAEASGKDLLSKSPELAKITSDPKVVGECLIRATGRATATMLRLGLMKSGSRASLENNYRRQFLAECLSEKTGKSVDEIKAALEGIDLQGSVAAGESARAATEQQLAQEQAAEGEEENKGECGTG